MATRNGLGRISGVATGTSAKTMIQLIAAANHAIKITEFGVSFNGVNNTHEPILVDLLRQTTAGTMSSLTLVKADDSGGDTLDTTAQHTATAEPTGSDVLRSLYVHPQTGAVVPVTDDAPIIVGAGDRLGLRVTAANDVSCAAHIAFEE